MEGREGGGRVEASSEKKCAIGTIKSPQNYFFLLFRDLKILLLEIQPKFGTVDNKN